MTDEQARLVRRQLEQSDHCLSMRLWGDFLLAHFPDEYREPPPPKHKTSYLPGSDGHKLTVLAQRESAGKGLWHPDDATPANSPRAAVLMGLDSRNLRKGIGQMVEGRPGDAAQPRWHVRLPDGREIVGLAAATEVDALRGAVRHFGLLRRLPPGSTVTRLP